MGRDPTSRETSWDVGQGLDARLARLPELSASLRSCYIPWRSIAMQTIIADGTDKKIRELIEAASKGPVTVIENGHPAAVILSPAEFDRLDEPDRARREAKDRLRATVAAMRADWRRRFSHSS